MWENDLTPAKHGKEAYSPEFHEAMAELDARSRRIITIHRLLEEAHKTVAQECVLKPASPQIKCNRLHFPPTPCLACEMMFVATDNPRYQGPKPSPDEGDDASNSVPPRSPIEEEIKALYPDLTDEEIRDWLNEN